MKKCYYLVSILSFLGILGGTFFFSGCGSKKDEVVATTSTTTSSSPTTSTALGKEHGCALLTSGRVKCWGSNSSGQLGAGTTADLGGSNEMGTNLSVIDLGTGLIATSLSLGWSHSCALLSSGTLKCWGENDLGQLGQGNKIVKGDSASEMGNNLSTILMGSNLTVSAVALGSSHTCALLSNATVKCFGSNTYGQLGRGNTTDLGDGTDEMGDNLSPILLGDRTAIAVTAGKNHTCIILDNSTVKCFGANNAGQLGIGSVATIGDAATEVGNNITAINIGGDVSAVVAKGDHTCAIVGTGTVKCWGSNTSGELGQGHITILGDSANEMGANLSIINLGVGQLATAIAIGESHSCALLTNGSMKCFGINNNGQLGQGHIDNLGDNLDEMGDNLSFILVGTGKIVTGLSAGSGHTCAVLNDHSVKCWGDNLKTQLGLGHWNDWGDNPDEMGNNLLPIKL